METRSSTSSDSSRSEVNTDSFSNESAPIIAAITGASGNIAYSLAFMIAQGQMFGHERKVILHFISRPSSIKTGEGLKLELEDCMFDLLEDIRVYDNYADGFKNIDVALLVGGCPRSPGMERKDLLNVNARLFKEQGEALNLYAKTTVKVCVVGNPWNTMALVCSKHAPNIPIQNFTAITRLDQNRALNQVAKKLNLKYTSLDNVIIWGNHSSTQYPDLEQATLTRPSSSLDKEPVLGLIKDRDWVQEEFIPKVQKRGAEIIAFRTISAVSSAAKAIWDHMYDWLIGTAPGKMVSMCVYSSENTYGFDKHLMFSFPCTWKDGEITIVNGLNLSEAAMAKIKLSEEELIQEKTAVFEAETNDDLVI